MHSNTQEKVKEEKEQVILLDKKVGETPLTALENFRRDYPEYSGVSMTYAGRLDPMASGLLIVLAGKAVHQKETYLALDKEYELEIFVGAYTDTHDVLGLVDDSFNNTHHEYTIQWQEIVQKYIGEHIQEYPPYSSKPVNGKPLFQYAREGTLDTIIMPSKHIHITSIDFLGETRIIKEKAHDEVREKVTFVTGDFRQKEVLESWNMFFTKSSAEEYDLVRLRVACSSGTYIRSLVHRMSKDSGIPLCLWNLRRTRIGEYVVKEC